MLGRHNVIAGDMTNWVGTDPVFVIGNGTGTGSSANSAFEVLKNGNTTIDGTLTAAGTVESESGGFKFPDGSVQTTASTGGGRNFGPLR